MVPAATAPPAHFHVTTVAYNVPAWIATGLALSMVCGRVLCRVRARIFGWDDLLIIAAMTACLVVTALLSAAITAGARVSVADARATLPAALDMSLAADTAALLSIPIAKISVAILLVLGIADLIWQTLACVKCDMKANLDAGVTLGCLSAVQDLALAVYPVFRIQQLQMSKEKKASLSLLLGTGVITATFAAVKTWSVYLIGTVGDDPFDIFGLSQRAGFWSVLENSAAVICACVPAIMPIVRWFKKLVISSFARPGSSDADGTSLASSIVETSQQTKSENGVRSIA